MFNETEKILAKDSGHAMDLDEGQLPEASVAADA